MNASMRQGLHWSHTEGRMKGHRNVRQNTAMMGPAACSWPCGQRLFSFRDHGSLGYELSAEKYFAYSSVYQVEIIHSN